eukprot:TRINITY_DN79481_c0_g1_i1.p1 TRINITY_DN79481_c0_g1~~TRINITY_DN79481_c0_g1_i1.p1  ORF type:complete len:519 (-),score=110.25 TRINITY_DN79481_c0_g1_i1:485-2041(-)
MSRPWSSSGSSRPGSRNSLPNMATWSMSAKLKLMESKVMNLDTGKLPLSRSASAGSLQSTMNTPGLGRSMRTVFDKTDRVSALQKQLKRDTVNDVRALGGDGPIKGEEFRDRGEIRTPHEALLARLKSRAARIEAEKMRDFLGQYRGSAEAGIDSPMDKHLDSRLQAMEQRVEELKQRSEELQTEAKDAEAKLEHANALNNGSRIAEQELQQMNAFERSQRRIQEDKREEEFQKQRDEVQAIYAKVHRRLQSELIELRDYKVLLREYRRIRLERLAEMLASVKDGRQLRHCVRVMIRNGAQRILLRLGDAKINLEEWMLQVLVNCCHVEIRLEDTEVKLLSLRRQALKPVRSEVKAMIEKTKAERLESLWTSTSQAQQTQGLNVDSNLGESGTYFDGTASVDAGTLSRASVSENKTLNGTAVVRPEMPPEVIADIRAAEAEVRALRDLLNDMRHNAAAVICNQIRQGEKGTLNGGPQKTYKELLQWGKYSLALLVSEDFAKTTMKQLSKLAPTGQMSQ